MVYLPVFGIDINRMKVNMPYMDLHGCYGPDPFECFLIKHIIPTQLKAMIINPLFVDVFFLVGKGHIYLTP